MKLLSKNKFFFMTLGVAVALMFLTLPLLPIIKHHNHQVYLQRQEQIGRRIEANQQVGLHLNQEFTIGKNQVEKIVGTDDTFEIYDMTPFLCDYGDCIWNGMALNWEITIVNEVARGSCSNCINVDAPGNTIYYPTTPATSYRVNVIDTDYSSYATIILVANDNWEQFDEQQKQQEERRQRMSPTEKEMDEAVTINFDQEFVVKEGDVFKIVNQNSGEVYYLKISLFSDQPDRLTYLVYKDVISFENPNVDGGFATKNCPNGTRPDPILSKLMVLESDYRTFAKMVASDSLPQFQPEKCHL